MSDEVLSLKINTGELCIMVNDDPTRLIKFNPKDVGFIDRFYSLLGEFETRLTDYKSQYESLKSVSLTDDSEIPEGIEERIKLINEVCTYLNEKIDELFGAGTAHAAFQGARDLDAYSDFFGGLLPIVKRSRVEVTAKYSNPVAAKKTKYAKR